MESRNQTINPILSQSSEVLASQDKSASMLTSALGVNSAASTPAKRDPQTELMMYDEIWAKLLILSKRLRDMMNAYNAQRQALAWELDVNSLTKTRAGIEKSFQAAMCNAAGGMATGVCTGAGAVSGLRAVKSAVQSSKNILEHNQLLDGHINRGRDVGHSINSGCAAGAGELTKEAETSKAEADLLNKSAHAYAKTQDELQAQAKDIMRQMLEMGQKYVEQYSQALQHVVR